MAEIVDPFKTATTQIVDPFKAPQPATQAGQPTLFSQMMQPIRDIPTDIAQAYRGGAQTVERATEQMHEAARRGEIPSTLSSMEYAGGALQELFSPITGTAKAIAGDPLRKAIPGKAGQIIGGTAELGASMVGPQAVSKSLEVASKALPGFTRSVDMLLNEGVDLTPGQIAQGMIKHGEDAARSWPGAGTVIAHGQRRALEGFNNAVVNRSLAQVGEKLPANIDAGPDAIGYARNVLSEKYEQLIPHISVRPDVDFINDLRTINQRNMRLLAPDTREQWTNTVKNIADRFANNNGTLDGRAWQEVDSELSYMSRQYARSENPAQRELARSVGDLRTAFRENLERVNPDQREQLQNLNTAWAMFQRAEGASVRRVASRGVFSPNDLLADIKKSTPQKIFARGDGLMQDLASAGSQVLPPSVPDSGTAARGLWAAVMLGQISPQVLLGYLGAAAPYSGPGMKAISSAARAVPAFSGATRAALATPAAGVLSALGDVNQQIAGQR